MRDTIVAVLEQEQAGEQYLLDISAGYPAEDAWAAFTADHPRCDSRSAGYSCDLAAGHTGVHEDRRASASTDYHLRFRWPQAQLEAEALDEAAAHEPEAVALLREVAASGVVHVAEPPGIDYVTVQIDDYLWEQVKRAALASQPAAGRRVPVSDQYEPTLGSDIQRSPLVAPAAEGLDVERLRRVFVALGYPHEDWRCERPADGEAPCDYTDEAAMFAEQYARLAKPTEVAEA